MTETIPLQIELDRITTQNLSPRARFGHVALLLAALAMSILVAALLVTEPALPTRTVIAFSAMLGIGLGWVAYATWVLRNRRVLLANQRVVAGRMAVAFSALFTVGAAWLGFAGDQPALRLAATLGIAMLAAAIALLVRAHRHRTRLLARRSELERQLSVGSTSGPGPLAGDQ